MTEETIRPKKEVLLSILSSESSSLSDDAGRFLPDAVIVGVVPPPVLAGREERCAAETVPDVRIWSGYPDDSGV